MSWNITPSPRGSLLMAALAFTVSVCFDVVVNEDCNRQNTDDIFQKSYCMGREIAVFSVWTEMQCLDNCLRLPYCHKYIFDREENRTCKLFCTEDIASAPGGASLRKTDGKCRSKAFQDFLLGTEDCPNFHRNDDSNIMPRESRENVNGGK